MRPSTTSVAKGDPMNTPATSMSGARDHLLRFRSLFNEGRGLAFPCDEEGHVDLDALSPTALNNYFFAHTLIGRDYRSPEVEAVVH